MININKLLNLSDIYKKASLEDNLCPCESGKLFKECHGLDEEISKIHTPSSTTHIKKLKYLCDIKTNFPDADFWLITRGSEEKLGKPIKEFLARNIGIKVKESAKDLIIPEYLFYAIEYLYQKGYFQTIAKGMLDLKHITTDDVKSIKIG